MNIVSGKVIPIKDSDYKIITSKNSTIILDDNNEVFVKLDILLYLTLNSEVETAILNKEDMKLSIINKKSQGILTKQINPSLQMKDNRYIIQLIIIDLINSNIIYDEETVISIYEKYESYYKYDIYEDHFILLYRNLNNYILQDINIITKEKIEHILELPELIFDEILLIETGYIVIDKNTVLKYNNDYAYTEEYIEEADTP